MHGLLKYVDLAVVCCHIVRRALLYWDKEMSIRIWRSNISSETNSMTKQLNVCLSVGMTVTITNKTFAVVSNTDNCKETCDLWDIWSICILLSAWGRSVYKFFSSVLRVEVLQLSKRIFKGFELVLLCELPVLGSISVRQLCFASGYTLAKKLNEAVDTKKYRTWLLLAKIKIF